MRNIFLKLGVSSRVDVARAIERERRADGPTRERRARAARRRRRAAGRARLHAGARRAACASSTTRRSGFAAISPVVGLYAVVLVGTLVAGPAWVWVLPVALAGQCLLLAVYAELASEFPIAGGAYQWSRRLIGGAYGWFTGWVAICAYAAANTTIAYLGAPWALTLARRRADARRGSCSPGMVLVLVCAARRRARRRRARAGRCKAGIAAEIVASVGIGARAAARLPRPGPLDPRRHARRRGAVGRLGRRGDARGARGRRLGVHRLRRVRRRLRGDARRRAPRPAGDLDRAAQRRRARDPQRGRGRRSRTPIPPRRRRRATSTRSRRRSSSSFGSWSTKPFAAVVLAAFLACGIAAQALTARTIYSIARDGRCRRPRFLRTVDRRRAPIGAIVATTVVACLGLLLGLDSAAVGSLIAFGTAAIYVAFLLVALAALDRARARHLGAGGAVRLGRAGLVDQRRSRSVWLAFETVNIAWPRELARAAGRALLPGLGGAAACSR